MSGVHVVYNLNKPSGQRVQSVELLCSNCSTPIYEPLDEKKTYGVILESYVYKGGDGFTMFEVYLIFLILFYNQKFRFNQFLYIIFSP